MRVLRILKAAGDVAEIIVATSIIIELGKQVKKCCHGKFCKAMVVEKIAKEENEATTK